MSTRPTPSPRARFLVWISADVVGGALMITAAIVALVWANSPWRASYQALGDIVVGPSSLHLDLSLATWAGDGLLAVFFFVVGVELKHELVAGSLRNIRQAAVPVAAAVGGMAVPALVYVAMITVLEPGPALRGWAIPTATDIAFALAVLAIFGRGLPAPLRVFLLTLAVVDDLLAIIVIAAFYSVGVDVVALVASFAAVGLFAIAVRMSRRMRWWLLVPLALAAWVLMHESGVHATIAGVLLGLTVPARPVHDEAIPRTRMLEHGMRPVSAGVALPVFAFFAAGVTVTTGAGSVDTLLDPVVLAIVAALVIGKFVGVLGITAIVTKLSPLRLPDNIGMRDLLPVGLLTGIGFTVSLLIAELSFEGGESESGAKLAVLIGSTVAAVLAAITLRWDARRARDADMNDDGVADAITARIGDRDEQ